MSITALVFYFSLSSNLFINWGLGLSYDKKQLPKSIVIFILLAITTSMCYGFVFNNFIIPFGLDSLAPIIFALILIVFFGIFHFVKIMFQKLADITFDDSQLKIISVTYAIALLTSNRFNLPMQILLSTFASVLAYIVSAYALDAILDRISLEPIPDFFKGLPILFICFGLIALAFSGIDSAFFTSITG